MAYEAMNNAGAMDSRLIVILNDNDMSIAPPVGAMSAYLAKLISGGTYRRFRRFLKQLAGKLLPKSWQKRAARAEEFTRGFWTGGTLFEELGFYYVGPIDGHNFDHLLPVLRNVRNMRNGPILVHVVTQKGKGYGPAEISADKFHGVGKFNVVTGAQEAQAAGTPPSYTKVFANALIEEARADDKIVAITAAMPSGTGLDRFAEIFPERSFDVGIAEQHAVTFAAGLAAEGLKPFAAIYSTFLQRAYDQVVHDVAIQKPAGPLRHRPGRAGRRRRPDPCRRLRRGLSLMPAGHGGDGGGRRGRADAHGGDRRRDRRRPVGVPLSARGGDRRRAAQARDTGLRSARAASCAKARRWRCSRSARGCRNAWRRPTSSPASGCPPPWPMRDSPSRSTWSCYASLPRTTRCCITVEEGSSGGFGALVLQALAREGLLDRGLKVRTLHLPDRFIEQNKPASDVCRSRARRPRHRRRGVHRARQGYRRRGRGIRLA